MIRSVKKAFDIFELFSRTQPSLSLTEISCRLGYPKATTYHILSTLVQLGYLGKDSKDCYYLSPKIIEISQNALINVELRDIAAPFLRELGDFCNESVYLATKYNDRILYIYAIETSKRLLSRSAVGDQAMLHCTGIGKALLAFLPNEEIVKICESGLPSFTENTIIDKEKLYKKLDEVKTVGYAIDNEEHEQNIFCIGAPIFNNNGAVIASCSVSGTDKEIIGSRKVSLAAKLIETSMRISRCMGFIPLKSI